jgi:hypothetical protein
MFDRLLDLLEKCPCVALKYLNNAQQLQARNLVGGRDGIACSMQLLMVPRGSSSRRCFMRGRRMSQSTALHAMEGAVNESSWRVGSIYADEK